MSDRQQPRALAPIEVVEQGVSAKEPMYARDIGLGGMFLLTARRWPRGSDVDLVIQYQSRSIPVQARVLRCDEDGVAFAFDKPSTKVRQSIRGILAFLFATGSPADERRGRRRRHVSSHVIWMEAGVERRGSLEDISLESARIVSDYEPTAGTMIYLFLPVQGDGTVEDMRGSEARVIRGTEVGFAVRFIDAGVAFHEAIAMLV